MDIICKAGGERMRTIFIILICSFGILACSPTKKLVYIDEWEGVYGLREYNCCGNIATPVKLSLKKLNVDLYEWKLYGFEENLNDTLFGRAEYKDKKLLFFVSNIEKADGYFGKKVKKDKPVFRIEYDNYSSEGEKLYIDYFTRWNNELTKYKSQNKLFAGLNYHFKSDVEKKKIMYKNK